MKMDIRTGTEFLPLIFVVVLLHQTTAASHSLQYLYTAVTEGTTFSGFTAVGLVDGETFVFYDSNTGKMIPKTKWIQFNSDDQYFKEEAVRMHVDERELKHLLSTVMGSFNDTAGVHSVQRSYGCELDDDGTTKGHDWFGYDGEDFISLDLNSDTWTAVNDEAVIIKNKWEANNYNDQKVYLEKICIGWLKKFMSNSRETVERKVPPEGQVFLQQHLSPPNLVCHATSFFPRAVNIIWQKDGKEVKEDVEIRETLPNQDGSFQKRIILRVSPEDLQKHKYTCVIQHSSLKEDLVLPTKIQSEQPGVKVNDNLPWIITFGVFVFAVYVLIVCAAIRNICKSGKSVSETIKSGVKYFSPGSDAEKQEEALKRKLEIT